MVIQDLEPEATYAYLGIEEGDGTDHHKMKAKIQKEHKRRIRLILKSELNAINKGTAIQYTGSPCSIIHLWSDNWKLDEIQDLDRITRKQLHMNQMLSEKANVNRI